MSVVFLHRGRRVFVRDRLNLVLQGKPLELFYGQIQEEVNPPGEQCQCIPKSPESSVGWSRNSGRILHAPMRQDRLTGEDRAGLPRTVADGNYEVPGLLIEAVETPAADVRPIGSRTRSTPRGPED